MQPPFQRFNSLASPIERRTRQSAHHCTCNDIPDEAPNPEPVIWKCMICAVSAVSAASPLWIAHSLERFRSSAVRLRAPASCRSRVSAVPRALVLLVPCIPVSQLLPFSCVVSVTQPVVEHVGDVVGSALDCTRANECAPCRPDDCAVCCRSPCLSRIEAFSLGKL